MFGISFSNPIMLHGLWAALLPLVIHLLNRRRTVTVPFSNVALLQALQHDRMRRVRLKQILLLLLRMLILALLALAFARPALQGAAAGASTGARTSAVLLLDRSLSMQYRTPGGSLFDLAQTRVRESLTLFDARDEVHLFLVDDRVEAMEAGRLEGLRSRLEVAQPSFRSTDLRPGLEAALETLGRSEMLNRELYVFTDLARNGWAGLPDTLAGVRNISVFLVPVRPERINNVGIRQAGPAGEMLAVGSPATLQVELANTGEVNRPDVAVQVYLDERRIAQQIVSVAAGEQKRMFVRFTPERGGAVSLRVELGDDDLVADNRYTSVLNIPEQVRVLLVGEQAEAMYYVRQALTAASKAQGTLAVTSVLPDGLAENLLDGADVIFLCNVARLSQGQVTALKRRVEAGAGLFICLGDQVDMRFYNQRLLPEVFPASLVSVVGMPGQSRTYHSLQIPLPAHPVFEELEQDEHFRSPQFYAYYQVRPGASVQSLVSFQTGALALAEAQIGEGRVMLLASGVDLDWSDFSLTGLFVPLMHQVSRYLSAGAFGQADYEVGASVYREIRNGGVSEALLRPPLGEAKTIWPEQRGASPVWPVGEVGASGLWEIFARERLADRFAVHVNEAEPDLSRISEGRLDRLFAGAHLQVVDADEGMAEAVMDLRLGRELWRPTLGLALLLLVVELLVVRTTQTSRKEASPESRLRSRSG